MPTVVWSRPALADLDRQYRFLKDQNPELASRAVQAIIQAGKSLAQSPQRGTPIAAAPGLRKLVVRFGKVGYLLHYTVLEDEVLILRVYHGRQNRPA
ncbi:type II toxin-antitoxin system RelE/ParE family toxin [filamentous cyanobacterium CCP3]|nr:type II toxin-antitoxin system RelE/ParE family toxin [filamentous cyanobacterium CCP3]